MALAGELANIIKRCAVARAEHVVAGHDSPYVFVRAVARVRNTRARGRQVDDFGVVWRRTCKEAGLEGRLFHDVRRSAARDMDRAGVSRHVAMKVTGHKTEAMHRRYISSASRTSAPRSSRPRPISRSRPADRT